MLNMVSPLARFGVRGGRAEAGTTAGSVKIQSAASAKIAQAAIMDRAVRNRRTRFLSRVMATQYTFAGRIAASLAHTPSSRHEGIRRAKFTPVAMPIGEAHATGPLQTQRAGRLA